MNMGSFSIWKVCIREVAFRTIHLSTAKDLDSRSKTSIKITIGCNAFLNIKNNGQLRCMALQFIKSRVFKSNKKGFKP